MINLIDFLLYNLSLFLMIYFYFDYIDLFLNRNNKLYYLFNIGRNKASND